MTNCSNISDNDYQSQADNSVTRMTYCSRRRLAYHDTTMRSIHLISVLILYSSRVDSWTICDSDSCICRYNNKGSKDFFGEIIDCSYNPNILGSDNVLPNTAQSLDLSRNNLTGVKPSKLLFSGTLEELLLNSNQIKEIEPSALQLVSLKRLDLSDNELDFVHPETFDRLRKLEYLNLANNRFTTFEKITFHRLVSLKEIVLDNNDLGKSLKDKNLFYRSGYGLTGKIESLSISGINLNFVHDNFFLDAYNLKKLIISNNNLKDIFELPFTLQYLDLSDNPIEEISSEDFSDVPGLKELKLNNLLIGEVSENTFSSLQVLVHLELERNQNLTRFSVFAFGQEVLDDADDFVLEFLSLKGSRLTALHAQLQVPLGQLIHLDLQGNPWNCDCKLTWLKRLQIQPNDYDHLRCATPNRLYNSRIFELDKKYFTCPAEPRHFGIAIAVIAVCVLLIAAALWIFMFIPNLQSRCNFVHNMRTPVVGYNILPVLSDSHNN